MKLMKSARELKKMEVMIKARVLHHKRIGFLAKFQEFTHISVALYCVKYIAASLKSSFSLGRLDIFIFFMMTFCFLFSQFTRYTEPNVPLPSSAFILSLSIRNAEISRRFSFFLLTTIIVQIYVKFGREPLIRSKVNRPITVSCSKIKPVCTSNFYVTIFICSCR